jgi:hypothetical protein
MSRCLSTVALAFLAAAVMAAPASDDKKASTADPEHLVQQLGSAKHAEREAAAKALNALGATALAALREGIKSNDPEIRRRAGDLLANVERQAASAAAMVPTKVRLKAAGVPLADVVRDLGRQANVRILLNREPVDLATRRVTMDTGETSFWEALDALCGAAKVSIRPTTVDSAPDDATAGVGMLNLGGALPPGMAINAAGVVFTTAPVIPNEGPLVLQDGTLPKCPTAIVGTVRVRLIPDRWGNQDRKPGEEMKWTLELLTEPRMRWVTQPTYRFESKPGLRLEATPHASVAAEVPPGLRRIAINNANIVGINGRSPGLTRHELPVYIKADSSAAIPELRGSLAGMVQATSGPVATIPDVTKEKASAATKDDVKMTITDYAKADDGTVTLTIELQRPAGGGVMGGIAIAGNVNRGGRPGGLIPPNIGRLVSGSDGMVESIKLIDEKGRPYEVAVNKTQLANRNGAIAATLTLECQPPAADAKPKALELHGPRSVAVEAPFTLHDVPAVQ